MRKENQVGKVGRFKRGLASAMLVATLAAQVAPLATVSAEQLNYEHGSEDVYKTIDTAQYRVNVNPMISIGREAVEFTPQGGKYNVQQIASYTSAGERVPVEGEVQTLNLKPNEVNDILLSEDGEYRITPLERVPGFYKDLGATTVVDAVGETTEVEASGEYLYAFPLIEAGVASEGQTVEFQPKLEEALADLEIEKLGDDGQPLANVTFEVYKVYDAQLHEEYGLGQNLVGTATTGSEGKVTIADLIEGRYYFVETEESVPSTYLPDSRRVEFDVRVGEDELSSAIVATDEDDIATVGNNIRGFQTGDTITRYNYIDPVQNPEETFTSVSAEDYWSRVEGSMYVNTTQGIATGEGEGIVYVNTNGSVDLASSVDIPKNFNDFETFSIVDELDERLTIDAGSIELRVIDNDTGVLNTIALGDNEALVHDGQTITLNAKDPAIASILEADNVDLITLTYTASVDTDEIAEGLEFVELTNTQTIDADNHLRDEGNEQGVTTRTTTLQVKEGRIIVDKDASDREGTALADADFQLYRKVEAHEEIEGELSHGGFDWVKAENPRTGANYFGTTDENGEIVFDSVPFGEYLLVETRAPEGYRLNNNHREIEINHDTVFNGEGANTHVETVTNMRRSQIFPGTGTMGNIVTLSVLAVAGGSLVYVTVKKKNEEEVETTEQAQ